MLGAAAEKAVLLLLEAIGKSINDKRKKEEIIQLLERGRLPAIYDEILDTLSPLTRTSVIPYSIHQGCTEHLMSLFEMIRVQRNAAVHPEAGIVSKEKMFLSLQALPAAIGMIYGLIGWLESNSI